MRELGNLLVRATADALALPIYAASTLLTGDNSAKPVLDRMSDNMSEIAKLRKESVDKKNERRRRVEEAVKKAEEDEEDPVATS